MSANKGIQARLSSTAEGSTALYALIRKKVWPSIIKQGTKLPCLVYSMVSDIPFHAMLADAPLRRARYEIAILSKSFNQVEDVARKVTNQLQDYSGEPSTHINIQRCFLEDDLAVIEIDSQTEAITYRRNQDYFVWYSTNI